MVQENEKVTEGLGPKVTPEQFFEAVGKTDVNQVREFLKRDLSAAIHMLEAVYRDQDTLNALADYLHGRLMNAKQKHELSKQPELFPS